MTSDRVLATRFALGSFAGLVLVVVVALIPGDQVLQAKQGGAVFGNYLVLSGVQAYLARKDAGR